MSSLADGVGPIAARLPSRVRREQPALDLLRGHFADTPGGYVAWSGGKDSTVALHLARRINPLIPVVWFDSGLEFPENRDYVHGLAEAWGLNFHTIAAQPDALTLLVQSGAWEHGVDWDRLRAATRTDHAHDTLVTGPAARAHARYGPGEVVGLRAGESVGRRILLAKSHGRYTRNDGTVVCAPIWRWSDIDVEAYLAAHGIPANPIYAKLKALGAPTYAQRVGLVVDGNAAETGRYTWLRAGWPHMWADLTDALPRLAEWR